MTHEVSKIRHEWWLLPIALLVVVLLAGCAMFKESASTQKLTVTVEYAEDGETPLKRTTSGPAPYVTIMNKEEPETVDCTQHQTAAGAEACERRMEMREVVMALMGGGGPFKAVSDVARADATRDVGVTKAGISGAVGIVGIRELSDFGQTLVREAGPTTVSTTVDNSINADREAMVSDVRSLMAQDSNVATDSATQTIGSAQGGSALDTNDTLTQPQIDASGGDGEAAGSGAPITTNRTDVDSETSLF